MHKLKPVVGLVSIITPAFNAECVIADAINSVLLQTYPFWQLLIVNDGSTDNTSEIVQQFDDPRITLISSSNNGVSAARNLALESALGEFITFLDADDALPPRSLESRVNLLRIHEDADIADGVFVEMCSNLQQVIRYRYPGHSGGFLPRLLRLDESVFKGVSLLLRARIINKVSFDIELTHCEDLLFFIQLSESCNPKYVATSDYTYQYRTGLKSAMSDVDRLAKSYLLFIRKLAAIPSLHCRDLSYTRFRISMILFITFFKNNNPMAALFYSLSALFCP